MNIQALIVQYGLPLMAGLILIGELGIPTGVPMELAILITGALAVHSPQQLVFGIILLTIGDVIGTTILHMIARHGSGGVLKRLAQPDGKAQRMLVRVQATVGGQDVALVGVGRMLPYARMWVTIATGFARIPIRRFLVGATPAAMIWVGVPLTAGYVFRTSIQQLEVRYSAAMGWLVYLVPIILLTALALLWVRHAPTVAHRLHRARFVMALAAGVGSVAFVAATARSEKWFTAAHTVRTAGVAIASAPNWALTLTAIAALLCILALTDLWTTRFVRLLGDRSGRLFVWQATATASTISLIALAMLLVTMTMLHRPVDWL